MGTDIKPLIEKLETKEALSFDDFAAVLKAYQDAMADGRINFREALRIGLAVLKILSEFGGSLQPSGTPSEFGFPSK
jgi:hypothetical protein